METITPVKSTLGAVGVYHFCFFCGDQLGPTATKDSLLGLAIVRDFKRIKCEDAYKGERWVCKDCRANLRRQMLK